MENIDPYIIGLWTGFWVGLGFTIIVISLVIGSKNKLPNNKKLARMEKKHLKNIKDKKDRPSAGIHPTF